MDTDVLILRFQIHSCEVLELLSDSGREKHCLGSLGQVLHDLIDGVLEPHIQDSIDFVENKHLHAARVKSFTLIHVLKETAGCENQDIHVLDPFLLILHVFTSDQEASTEIMHASEGSQHFESLDG